MPLGAVLLTRKEQLMTERITPVDLEKIQQRDIPQPADGSLGLHMPMHCPVFVSLHQKADVVKKGKTQTNVDIKGFTLVESWFGFGVKVYTKYQRNEKKLSLFVEDVDGMTKLCEWELS